MNVLVLGRNPSRKNVDLAVPFIGAPSYKKLKLWLEQLHEPRRNFILGNCSNDTKAKFNSKTLPELVNKVSTLILQHKVNVVLALGNDVARVCEIAGLTHYKLPHPSGLNRKLNDKDYELNILFDCELWLRSQL